MWCLCLEFALASISNSIRSLTTSQLDINSERGILMGWSVRDPSVGCRCQRQTVWKRINLRVKEKKRDLLRLEWVLFHIRPNFTISFHIPSTRTRYQTLPFSKEPDSIASHFLSHALQIKAPRIDNPVINLTRIWRVPTRQSNPCQTDRWVVVSWGFALQRMREKVGSLRNHVAWRMGGVW